MKDSIRHSVRFVCFAAGFVLLLLISSKIFAPKNNAKESGIDDPNANGILSETEQTIDVLFLGDSECYSAFIPMQLWKKYGITSYNCGTAMQHLYYTEEFLHKAFERQSPKVVFLETNAIYLAAGRWMTTLLWTINHGRLFATKSKRSLFRNACRTSARGPSPVAADLRPSPFPMGSPIYTAMRLGIATY